MKFKSALKNLEKKCQRLWEQTESLIKCVIGLVDAPQRERGGRGKYLEKLHNISGNLGGCVHM